MSGTTINPITDVAIDYTINSLVFTRSDSTTYTLSLDELQDRNAVSTVLLEDKVLKFTKQNGDTVSITLPIEENDGIDNVNLIDGNLYFYRNNVVIKSFDFDTLINNIILRDNPIVAVNVLNGFLVFSTVGGDEYSINLYDLQDRNALQDVTFNDNTLKFTQQDGDIVNIDLTSIVNFNNVAYNQSTSTLTFYKGGVEYLSINLANPTQSIDISSEISSRISSDSRLSTDLKNEISNRQSTDNLLFTEISTKLLDYSGITNLYNTVTNEISNRQSSDESLSTEISTNINLIEQGDASIVQQFTNKTNEIKTNVNDLLSTVTTEQSQRISTDASITNYVSNIIATGQAGNIALETSQRISDVSSLSTKINSNNVSTSTQISTLLSNVSVEKSQRTTTDNSLSTLITTISTTGADITPEISNRISSDNSLNDIISIETSHRTSNVVSIDSRLSNLSINISGNTSLSNLINNTVSTLLSSESSSRLSSDNLINDSLINHISTTSSNVLSLSSSISSDNSIRTSNDNSLSTMVVRLSIDAIGNDGINDEISNRISNDASLKDVISVETSNRNIAEISLSGLVSTEAFYRISSDSSLVTLVTNNSGSTELVIDMVNVEASERVSGDSSLTERIISESSVRFRDDNNISLALSGETSQRISTNKSLSTAISILNTSSATSNDLSSEISKRLSSDLSLNNDITTEVSTRISNVNSLATSLYYESTSRTSVDDSIITKLDRLSNDTPSTINLTDEISNRISSDDSLTDKITVEKSLIYTDINGLTTSLSNETSLRQSIDINTLTSLSTLNYNSATNENLSTEISNRISSDNTLTDVINTETSIRISNVINLSTEISDEAYTRNSTDTSIISTVIKLSNDSTTTDNLSSEISNRISSDNSLKDTISTETSIRLNNVASLSISLTSETSNRVSTDTSLSTIVNRLSTDSTSSDNLLIETSERISSDNSLKDTINNENSLRISVENSLSSSINVNSTIRNSTDALLSTNITSLSTNVYNNVSNESSLRISADNSLTDKITTEISQRSYNINSLSIIISGETSSRITNDKSLSTAINNLNVSSATSENLSIEISSRLSSDNSINDKLTNEISSRILNVNSLSTSISGETFIRLSTDNSITNHVNQLSTDSYVSTSTEISSQVSNRISTDTSLNDKLDTNISIRLSNDNSLSSSISSVNSIKTSVDNSLSTSISTLNVNSATKSELSIETSNRVSTDNSINDVITSEISTRILNVNSLSSSISGETFIRKSTDTSIITNVNTLSTNISSNISTNISSESSKRISSDSSLTNSISTETSIRLSNDNILSINLSGETSIRSSVDLSIIQTINTLSNDSSTSDALAIEVSNRMSSDTSLNDKITSEISTRVLNVNSLSTVISGESFIRNSTDSSIISHINLVSTDSYNSTSTVISSETSSRISGDNSLTNNVSVETSIRVSNVNSLSISLSTEKSSRLSIDNSLSTNVSSLNVNSATTASLSTETSNRISGDNSLGDIITTESSFRLSVDTSLSTSLSTETSLRSSIDNSIITTINTISNDNTTSDALANEVSNRISGDNSLTDNISIETSVRLSKDNLLSTSISSESTLRTSTDTVLSNRINTISNDTTLSLALSTETSTRISTDNSLNSKLDTNVSLRISNDNSLSVAVSGETNSRISTDNSLSSSIHNVSSDTTLSVAISIETSKRLSSDSSLTTIISSESSTRLSKDNVLTTSISTETSNRTLTDSSLSSEIYALKSDTTTSVEISSEMSNRISSDLSLNDKINSEISNRIDSDNSLSIVLSGETSIRSSVDSSLIETITNISNDTTISLALSTETSKRLSSDSSLTAVVSTESSTRLSKDNVLSISIVNENTSRISTDNSLSNAILLGLSGNTSDISSEVSQRISTDSSLINIISIETSQRVSSDNSVSFGLSTESSTRLSTDNSISLSLSTESSNRLTKDNSLSTQISSETSSRISGDNSLTNNISVETSIRTSNVNSLSTTSSTETSLRTSTDVVLSNRINTISNDTTLSLSLSTETSSRISGDNSLNASVSTESSTRLSKDNILSTSISTETSSRISDVTSLSNDVSSESSTRLSTDLRLNDAISNESSLRISSDLYLKNYADYISAGLDPKESVKAATTTNITISATTIVDGLTLLEGYRILVKNQTNQAQNGIYAYISSTLVRAEDSDGNPANEVSLGNYVFVESGNTNMSTGWVLNKTSATGGTINVGVDTQVWTQFAGHGTYSASEEGLTLSGTKFSLVLDGTTLTKSSSGLKLNNTLSTTISNNTVNISNEISNRLSGDNSLGDRITSENSSRTSGDNSLSTSISTETSKRISTDNSLSTLIISTQTSSASDTNALSTDVYNEISNRISTDNSLTNSINTVSTNVTTETSSRISTDNSISNNLSTEISNRIENDNTLSTDISSETDSRISTDNSLVDADTSLTNRISTETSSRFSSDNLLSSSLFTESSNRNVKDNSLSTQISLESSLRISTDLSLNTANTTVTNSLSTETSNRLTLDNSLSTQISLEISNRNVKDNSVSTQISTESSSRISADSSLTTTLTTNTTSLSNAFSTETSNRLTLDNSLSTAVSSETSNRTTTDNSLSSAVSSESSLRVSTDSSLNTRINTVSSSLSTETSNRLTIDTSLSSRIYDEEINRSNNVTSLSTSIVTESSVRVSTDLSLNDSNASTATSISNNLSTETYNRLTNDSSLSTSIFNNSLTQISGVTSLSTENSSESSLRISTDLSLNNTITTNTNSLSNNISTEVSTRNTNVLSLSNTLSTETSNRLVKDNSLSTQISSESSLRVSTDSSINNTLTTNISSVSTAISVGLSSETSTRLTTDNSLSTRIVNEEINRTNNVNSLSNSVSVANSSRISGDSSLNTQITTNTTSLSNALSSDISSKNSNVVSLSNNISSETSTRLVNDNSLSTSISIVNSQRISGDNNLNANVSVESSQRISSDNVISLSLSTETSQRISSDIRISVEINDNIEPTIAESLNDLNARINSLSELIQNMTFENGIFDNLDIVKSFNVYGNTNLILTGVTTPTIIPDIIGQVFVDTTNGKIYQSKGNTSSSDWKNISDDSNLSSSLSTEISTRTSNVNSLSNSISVSNSQRISSDSSLNTQITTNTTSLSNALSSDISSKNSSVSSLSINISSESSSRLVNDNSLSTTISISNSQRISTDSSLNTQLNTNTTSLSSRISVEENTRNITDSSLSTKIYSIENIQLSGDTSISTDLYTESSLRISSDLSLTDSITTNTTSLSTAISSKISTEISTRLITDNSLSTRIVLEESTRNTNVTSLSNSVSVTTSQRISTDSSLNTTIGTISTNLVNESNTRNSVDNSLSNNISSEISTRIVEVNYVASNLSTETSSRVSTDLSINDKFNNYVSLYTEEYIYSVKHFMSDVYFTNNIFFTSNIFTYTGLILGENSYSLDGVPFHGMIMGHSGYNQWKLGEYGGIFNFYQSNHSAYNAYNVASITPYGISAHSFIVSGGTSAQFLKADGSLDSTTIPNEISNRISSDSSIINILTNNNNSLSNNISSESSTRLTIDNSLSTKISSIENINLDDVSSLSTNIETEKSSRISTDSSLNTQINTVSSTLSNGLSVEVSTRTTNINSLSNLLSSNISIRNTADISLSTAISIANSSRISGDNNLSDVMNTNTSSLSTRISNEETNRTTNDNSLSTRISNEETNRTNNVNSLSTSITNEANSRISTDLSLNDNITSVRNSLSTNISSEGSSRIANDNSLSNAISSESSSRNVNDNSLSTSISSESSQRISGDNSLNSALSSYLSTFNLTYPEKVYTIDLLSQPNTNFYPVQINNAPIGWKHFFTVDMPSQSGGEAYNMQSITVEGRGGGWTDQTPYIKVNNTFYDTNERSILGIYKGSQSFIGLVVYLRGGKSYYIRTNSSVIQSYINTITINDSTFAIKDVNFNDINGTTTNASILWNGIYANYGDYFNGNLNVEANIVTNSKFLVNGGTSNQFLKADGSLDSTSLPNEISSRISTDSSLTNQLTTNTNTVSTNISNETSSRISFDNSLSSRILTEETNRTNNVNSLSTSISSESSQRISGDNSLNVVISNESLLRISSDLSLSNTVNNIQIGGRNYITGTKYPYLSSDNWDQNGWIGALTIDNVNNGLILTATNGWHSIRRSILSLASKTVTVTCKAKYISGNEVPFYIGTGYGSYYNIANDTTPNSSVINSSSYTQITKTFTLDAQGNFVITVRQPDESGLSTTVLLTDLKLELGNKPTDWTPAIEDVDANISTSISSESSLRVSTDLSLNQQLTNNTSSLTTRISNEETNRSNNDNSLSTAISSESSLRISTDSSLNTALGNYLPLAGGTMTGSVFLPLNIPALRFGNGRAWDSAIAHDTASYEVESFMSKYAGSKYRFKVGFDPTGFTIGSFVNMTNADLEIGAGYCKINNNTVWHAGNMGTGSGLDADTLDGLHGSKYAKGERVTYGINLGGIAGWVRLANTSGDAYGTISITNYYNYNSPAPISFTFATNFLGVIYINQLGGISNIWSKIRIVYPTTTDNEYYIEGYCNALNFNDYTITLSNSVNVELYKSYTAGSIPTDYSSKEITIFSNSISAEILRSYSTGFSAGFGGIYTNINPSVLYDATSYIEIIAGNGSVNGGTAIGFHNPNISSASLGYYNTDNNNGYFNFLSDDSSWNVRVNGNTVFHSGNSNLSSVDWTTQNLNVYGSSYFYQKTRFKNNIEIDGNYGIFFGNEESFGGSDIGGSDYGYIVYDNNSTTYGSGGGETSVLRIGSQNDGKGSISDCVAIESAANIYLRPGAWGGGGDLLVGTYTSNYNVYHGGNAPSLFTLYNKMGRYTYINLSSLDANTYYPVIFSQPIASIPLKVHLYKNLDSINKPSWATHDAGFSLQLQLETTGNGWGVINNYTNINTYHWMYANQSPVGKLGCSLTSRWLVVWLRGGTGYNCLTPEHECSIVYGNTSYTDNNNVVFSTITTPENLYPLASSSDGSNARLTSFEIRANGYNATLTIDSKENESMVVFKQNETEKYRIGYESTGGYVYSPYGYLLRYDFINTRLGIGTSTPQYTLDVNGDTRASRFIKLNGTVNQFLKADGSSDDNQYIYHFKTSASVANGTDLTTSSINVENENIITGTGNYYHILNLGNYTGGGFSSQILFPYQSDQSDTRMFIRTAIASSWRSYREVYHTGNANRSDVNWEVNSLSVANNINLTNYIFKGLSYFSLNFSGWGVNNGETNVLGQIFDNNSSGNSRFMIHSGAGNVNMYIDGTIYVNEGQYQVWHTANHPTSCAGYGITDAVLTSSNQDIYGTKVFYNNTVFLNNNTGFNAYGGLEVRGGGITTPTILPNITFHQPGSNQSAITLTNESWFRFTKNSSETYTTLVASNYIIHGGTSSQFLKADGSVDSTPYWHGGNHPSSIDGYGITNAIKTWGTINNNIDADWGESFVTFDPIPTGTPPISSPNIRTINIGNNFSRRTQLAFNYESDHAFFRRRTDDGWNTWREFYHTGNSNLSTVEWKSSTNYTKSINFYHPTDEIIRGRFGYVASTFFSSGFGLLLDLDTIPSGYKNFALYGAENIWLNGATHFNSSVDGITNLTVNGIGKFASTNKWGVDTQIGRMNDSIMSTLTPIVGATNGNLHLDAGAGQWIYLQYYQSGLSNNSVIINNTGNVGIGISPSSTYKLDVQNGNARFSEKVYLDAAEGLGVYGIHGRFGNQHMHLYNSVNIGDPSGWGNGQSYTPNQGLSVYGASTFGIGRNEGILVYGNIRNAQSNMFNGLNINDVTALANNRDYQVDYFKFNAPNTVEYSTDNGSNWTSVAIPYTIFLGKTHSMWGGFDILPSWTNVRFTWQIGYIYFNYLSLTHSTNGNDVKVKIQKSEDNTTYADLITPKSFSSWPGYTGIACYGNTNTGSSYIRILFDITHNTSNTITLGNMSLFGSYGRGYGIDMIYDWDWSRNITTKSALSTNGTIRVKNANNFANYGEGLRLQAPDSSWCSILLGGTSDIGTNTYAWSIHRKDNNDFSISRNSSDGLNGLILKTSGNMILGKEGMSTSVDSGARLQIYGSAQTTFEAAQFYNTYGYDGVNKCETRISLGKLEAGTTYQPMGAIGAAPSNNGDSGQGYLSFYTRMTQSLTEKMRLTKDGNLLINTQTDAGYKLDVNGTGRFTDDLTINGNVNLISSYYSTFQKYLPNPYYGSAIILSADAGSTQKSFRLVSRNNGTADNKICFAFEYSTSSIAYKADPSSLTYSEALRIVDNGNIGINTTNPQYKLDVIGTGRFTGDIYANSSILSSYYKLTNSANNPNLALVEGSNNWYVQGYNNHLYLGRGVDNSLSIDTSGNVSIGTTTDYGYKLFVNGLSYFTQTLSAGDMEVRDGGNYKLISPNTTGSWARGLNINTYDAPTTYKGGIGFYGDNNVFSRIYLGAGASPWSNNSLRIQSDRIDTDLPLYSTNNINTSGNIRTSVLTLINDRLENWSNPSDDAAVAINYAGYNGGTAYYRNFVVYDGKYNQKFRVNGSSGLVVVTNALNVGSTVRTSGVFSAGESQDDGYGYVNVCRTNTINNASCFSWVRAGKIAFGLGFNTSNEIVIGSVNTDKTINPWMTISNMTTSVYADFYVPGALYSGNRIFTGYDPGVSNSISCSGWFRSNGSSGWYNASYGTGIYSDTNGIVRTYDANKFKVYNTESDSISTAGGITAGDIYSSSNIHLNNERYIKGKNTSGTYYQLFGVDSDNYAKFGDAGLTSIFKGAGVLMSTSSVTNIIAIYDTVTINAGTTINGNITATNVIKSGSSDSYFLLGGGGHVTKSTYALSSDVGNITTLVDKINGTII